MNRFTQIPSSGNTLHILLKGIQRLPSLSSLSLNLYKGCLDDQKIDILCSGLKLCKSLITLDLNLQACFYVTNQGIHKLLLIATKDLDVSFLRLGLYVLPPANESTFYKDLDSILKPAARMKDFPSNLRVSYSYREVLQLTIIQFSLKNFTTGKPKKFYIRFHQIDDSRVRWREKVTRELQLNLPCLKYIKALDLSIVSYYGKENFSYDLAACIKSMESLESLTFNFDAKSSLKEYSWLAKPFEELKTRAQLTTLNLEFHKFDFNDKQVQHFVSCLSKIGALKALGLDFLESKVPPTIFETFAKIRLKALTRLYFALSLNGETKTETLKGLERFCASLENLKKLKDLDIRLKDTV